MKLHPPTKLASLLISWQQSVIIYLLQLLKKTMTQQNLIELVNYSYNHILQFFEQKLSQMKRFFIIILFLSITLAATAQVRWAVKSSVNLSKINREWYTAKLDGYNMRLGFNLGVLAEYSIKKWYNKALFLQPELLFSYYGSNYKLYSTDGNNYERGALVFNEFTLPINLKYSFTIKNQNVFLIAGTYFGYIIKGNDKRKNQASINLYNSPGYSHFNCGISGGAGIEISRFIFDIRYQYGLVDITRPQTDLKTRINSIMLSAGYFF